MATLTELKQQLGITDLPLKTELDQNGNKTDWMSYKDDEKRINVRMHKNLAEKLKVNPQTNNLALETSTKHEGQQIYTLHTIIKLSKIDKNDRIILSVVIATFMGLVSGYIFDYSTIMMYYGEELFSGFNYFIAITSFIVFWGTTYLFSKTSRYPYKTHWNRNDVIIAVLVVGVFVGIVLGHVFGKVDYEHYIQKEGYYSFDGRYSYNKYYYSKFNYLVGIAFFIISGGITYLILKRKMNKQ